MLNEFAPIVREQSCIGGGRASELQRYRCCHCNHTFNALTGTALAGLGHKDKWFDYEQAMVQGLSICKAAISYEITRNTSFKWRHRFLRVPAIHQSNKMNGIVEADESYFLESKGQRHLPRAAHKRGGKAAKRGTSKEQTLMSLRKIKQFQQLITT